jgi:hypothetical protein
LIPMRSVATTLLDAQPLKVRSNAETLPCRWEWDLLSCNALTGMAWGEKTCNKRRVNKNNKHVSLVSCNFVDCLPTVMHELCYLTCSSAKLDNLPIFQVDGLLEAKSSNYCASSSWTAQDSDRRKHRTAATGVFLLTNFSSCRQQYLATS